MGQHKYNPNCQLAREGKLPPKPKKMGKRERERLMYAKCYEILCRPLVKAIVKGCNDVDLPELPKEE